MIEAAERSTGAEVLGACDNGIMPWSWKGWDQVCSMGGVSLFVEGFAASDDEIQTTNGGGRESWGAPIIDLYKAQGARFLNRLRGSFAIAFNQMDFRTRLVGERAGDRNAGKSTARSEVDPDSGLRCKSQELKRISDMACPQLMQRRGRHEVELALPSQQHFYVSVEPRFRFT